MTGFSPNTATKSTFSTRMLTSPIGFTSSESRIGKNFRLMCQILKDEGFDFKIKYPVENDGRWKFADAYLPKYNVCVLLMNEMAYIGLPCWSKSDRELFFEEKCSVIAVLPDELPKLRERLSVL